MKTLLITRPLEEVEALETALNERGFQTFAEPLLIIEPEIEGGLALKKALARSPQAILITSRQGLKALAAVTATRSTPLICVGAATAEYASGLGFAHVRHGETAQAVITLAEKHCTPAGASLLYARGKDISTDIAGALEERRFKVESVILYHANAAKEFSPELRALIAGNRIDGALFFSARTAAIYATLVKKHKLAKTHQLMHAVCMSEAVADELRMLPWGAVGIAQKPDMAHMLKAADKTF